MVEVWNFAISEGYVCHCASRAAAWAACSARRADWLSRARRAEETAIWTVEMMTVGLRDVRGGGKKGEEIRRVRGMVKTA
jgi:hypothetical protein